MVPLLPALLGGFSIDFIFEVINLVGLTLLGRCDAEQRRRFGTDQILGEPLPSFRIAVLGIVEGASHGRAATTQGSRRNCESASSSSMA